MLGNKITQLRKRKNITQVELSKILKVSPQAISKWEKNISQPSFDLIVQIAQYFDVSLDYFKEDDNTIVKQNKKENNILNDNQQTIVEKPIKQNFNFANLLYNNRQWFLSVLIIISISLFFCNFISISFNSLINLSFSGFQAIIAMFLGDKFMSYLYGVKLNSYNTTLTTLTSFVCLCYLVYFICGVVIIIKNIINYFNKKENINNLNLSNSTFMTISALGLIVLRFLIEDHFASSSTIIKISSTGIWFILAISILSLTLSIYFKKCKNNKEVFANEDLSFRKQFIISVVILLGLLLVSYSLPIVVFNINEGLIYNLYNCPEIKYGTIFILVLIGLNLLYLLHAFFREKIREVKTLSLIFSTILLISNIYVLFLCNYKIQIGIRSYTTLAFLPLLICALLLFISVKYSILLHKVKKEYDTNIDLNTNLNNYFNEINNNIHNTVIITVPFGIALSLIIFFVFYFTRRIIEPRDITDNILTPIIIATIAFIITISLLVLCLIRDKKSKSKIKNQFKLALVRSIKIAMPFGLLFGIAMLLGLWSNASIGFFALGLVWLFANIIFTDYNSDIANQFYREKNIQSFDKKECENLNKRTNLIGIIISLIIIFTFTPISNSLFQCKNDIVSQEAITYYLGEFNIDEFYSNINNINNGKYYENNRMFENLTSYSNDKELHIFLQDEEHYVTTTVGEYKSYLRDINAIQVVKIVFDNDGKILETYFKMKDKLYVSHNFYSDWVGYDYDNNYCYGKLFYLVEIK